MNLFVMRSLGLRVSQPPRHVLSNAATISLSRFYFVSLAEWASSTEFAFFLPQHVPRLIVFAK